MVSPFDPLACNRNLAPSPNRLSVAHTHRGPPNDALAPRSALSAPDDHQLDAPLPASIALLPSSGVHGTLQHCPHRRYDGRHSIMLRTGTGCTSPHLPLPAETSTQSWFAVAACRSVSASGARIDTKSTWHAAASQCCRAGYFFHRPLTRDTPTPSRWTSAAAPEAEPSRLPRTGTEARCHNVGS